MIKSIENQALTAGLIKSMKSSNVSSKIERSIFTSQFNRRGFYRKIIDPPVLDKMKNEWSLEDSDDENADKIRIKPTYKMNRVAKVIDVSEGIGKDNLEVFEDDLAKKHRACLSSGNSRLLYTKEG